MKTAPQAQAPTIQQYSAYNEAFNFFNKWLFGSKLGPALLAIARNGRSRGHFTPRKWANEAGESVHEIALSPDLLAEGMEATMVTLMGLMARQLRWQEAIEAGDGKAAATAARGYHDARLVEILLGAGLLPRGKDGEPSRGGWNLATSVVFDGPADDALGSLPNKARLPWDALVEEKGEEEGKPRRKTGRLKYTCPRCDSHVLGRPGLYPACTGDVGHEHEPVRMIGEDEPFDDSEEVGDYFPEDGGEEAVDAAEPVADSKVKEPVEGWRRRPATEPDPKTAAAERHLERLDEWADALERDGAVSWADLARIEARWGAVHQAIADHRRRWVGMELEVEAGEPLSVCDEEERWLAVSAGTRVRVQGVSTNLMKDDKVECVIVGGKHDGRRAALLAVLLRELPPEFEPARGVEQPDTPRAASALLGYVTGEVHLAGVEGKATRRLCDGGEVAEWQYGTVADVTCERCREMSYTSDPERPSPLSLTEGAVGPSKSMRRYVLAKNRLSTVHFTEDGRAKCGTRGGKFRYEYGSPEEVNCSRCLVYNPTAIDKPDVMPGPTPSVPARRGRS
ncbi:hypothetical protein [Tautonia plasticadhaerens]|uniref:Uncharacterized protein n=1 Tax=Tautonia plasticadhaerens TaxID=2527974 RepID=A0A518H7W5_9BACT|nr:hypothetical protein [Tautonia plasticadhaerens]QDV36905.1 hypothetical protein ElP_48350 [Tautonia plasticadhaerens]